MFPNDIQMSTEQTTIAHALDGAGYETAYIGKGAFCWLLYENEADPDQLENLIDRKEYGERRPDLKASCADGYRMTMTHSKHPCGICRDRDISSKEKTGPRPMLARSKNRRGLATANRSQNGERL